MVSKSEVLLWPANFALRQAARLGGYSVEATKALARRHIELGQTTLRLLDPQEFVRHREEVGVEMEIENLKKDLRSHSPKDPKYDQFVRFSSQTWLKLAGEWADSGTPVSKQGIEQLNYFLSQQGVHPEVIAGVLDQLQVEMPTPTLANAEVVGHSKGVPYQPVEDKAPVFEQP
ncbi:MAG TPA: hypothetical protein VFI84_03450 [Candidatus Saccharimonadales bacterium]|nr:hypothetical protein [Candidatus Saccharimonadales bacterium]